MTEIIRFFCSALLGGSASVVLIRRDRTPADAAFGVTSGQTVRTLSFVFDGKTYDVAVYADNSEEANYGLARAGVAVRHLLTDAGVPISNMQ